MMCKAIPISILVSGLVIIVVCLTVTSVQASPTDQEISLGFGWRVLNYSPLKFPPKFTSDLRWFGIRLRIGNNFIGGGKPLTENTRQVFIEGLVAVSKIFSRNRLLYLTTGATLAPWVTHTTWPIGKGWGMYPWVGMEVDVLRWSWLHLTGKVEVYIPREDLPDSMGVGIMAYLFPLKF